MSENTQSTVQQKTASATSAPLTHWNWTPDIVASVLGGVFGTILAVLLGFLDSFLIGTAPRIFLALVVLGVATGFAHICYHMELTSHRYLRQAFSMLTPFAIAFFTIHIILFYLSNTITTQVGNLNANFGAIVPIDKPAGQLVSLVSVFTTAGSNAIGVWTAIMAVAILIPFVVHTIRDRSFKIWWLWEAVFPLTVCGILSLLL